MARVPCSLASAGGSVGVVADTSSNGQGPARSVCGLWPGVAVDRILVHEMRPNPASKDGFDRVEVRCWEDPAEWPQSAGDLRDLLPPGRYEIRPYGRREGTGKSRVQVATEIAYERAGAPVAAAVAAPVPLPHGGADASFALTLFDRALQASRDASGREAAGFAERLASIQADRRADMELFTSLRRSEARDEGGSALVVFLQGQVSDLRAELSREREITTKLRDQVGELRAELAELKARKRNDSFLEGTVEKALPMFERLMERRRGSKPEARREGKPEARREGKPEARREGKPELGAGARPEGERLSPVSESAGEGDAVSVMLARASEGALDEFAKVLPPLEEYREAIRAGKVGPVDADMVLRLYRAGRLPADYVEALHSLATLAATEGSGPA